MAIIPDKCIGGFQYPIVGRLELRTILGFRINDTFANLSKRVSLNLINVTSDKYQVNFFPGSTLGTMFFSLFVYDDYFLGSPSPLARLVVDGVQQD